MSIFLHFGPCVLKNVWPGFITGFKKGQAQFLKYFQKFNPVMNVNQPLCTNMQNNARQKTAHGAFIL